MGIFSPKHPTYAPPLDRAKSAPTLLGGEVSDALPEPRQPGTDYAQAPADAPWRIELRRFPIPFGPHRAHAVLALVGPNGDVAELNGIPKSRNTGEWVDWSVDGAHLGATSEREFGAGAKTIAIVAAGSSNQINNIWERGRRAAVEITAKNYDYKAHDPAFEIAGSGGQIQNSNSVAYTLGRAMGLDLDDALRRTGMEESFPGWGRDLLDPGYKRYVTPPQFPPANAP